MGKVTVYLYEGILLSHENESVSEAVPSVVGRAFFRWGFVQHFTFQLIGQCGIICKPELEPCALLSLRVTGSLG